MNASQFRDYFKKCASTSSDSIRNDKIVSSAGTVNITNAELSLAENEIMKSYTRPKNYHKDIHLMCEWK